MGQSQSQRAGRTSVVRASTIARASVATQVGPRAPARESVHSFHTGPRGASASVFIGRGSVSREEARRRGSLRARGSAPNVLEQEDKKSTTDVPHSTSLTKIEKAKKDDDLIATSSAYNSEDVSDVGKVKPMDSSASQTSDVIDTGVIDLENGEYPKPPTRETDSYTRMVNELYEREQRHSQSKFARFMGRKGLWNLSYGHWISTAIIMVFIGLMMFIIFSEHDNNTHDNEEFGKLHAASVNQPYDYYLLTDHPLDYVEYHIEMEWEAEDGPSSGGHRRRSFDDNMKILAKHVLKERETKGASQRERRNEEQLILTGASATENHTGTNNTLLTVYVDVVQLINGTLEVIPGFSRSSVAADEKGEILMIENVNLKDYKNAEQLAFRVTVNSGEPAPFIMKVYQVTGFGYAQVPLAGATLVFMYVLIITEVVHRTIAALLGMAITLTWLIFLGKFPTVEEAFFWLEHGVLMLLFGMMLIVHVISTTGVFEWTAIQAYKLCRNKLWLLMVILATTTGFLSAFLDNVTTMLLMAPVTIRLASLLNVDPRPLLLCECIMSNIGGTATMIGDPPNIIIGQALSSYIGFVDFLIHLMPGVLLMFPFALWFLYWYFRKDLNHSCHIDNIEEIEKEYEIKNLGLLMRVGIIFLGVLILFFTEPVHHVDVAWISIIGAIFMLVVATPTDAEEALENVEWDTLVFFSALFIMIHGLSEMGLIRWMGDVIGDIIATAPEDSQLTVAIVIIIWVSGIVSSFLDNIPYTTTMVPVILALANDVNLNLDLEPLAWALAFGACLGGNGTIIGASANLVTGAVAARNNFEITFWQWFKVGFPTMLITLVFATFYCLLRYVWIA